MPAFGQKKYLCRKLTTCSLQETESDSADSMAIPTLGFSFPFDHLEGS